MRLTLFAAVSSVALIAGSALAQDAGAQPEAAPAEAQAPAAPAAPATGAFTDDELRAFAGAMDRMQAVAQQIQGGQPTEEQQAEMAAAVEASGLEIERFNAISGAVSADAGLRARIGVLTATPSAPGSVGAGVSDAEAGQFAAAMNGLQPIIQSLNGAAPSEEQQGQMAAAIEASGLSLERFNEISGAVGQDEHLRARVALAASQG